MAVTATDSSIERVSELVSGTRRFVFAAPIEVEVTHPDSTWVCWHHPTGLNSYGLSREEAWEAFCEDVAFCWDVYAQVPDAELGKGAIRLKQQLLTLIRAVEPA